jgi:hypothetical protein
MDRFSPGSRLRASLAASPALRLHAPVPMVEGRKASPRRGKTMAHNQQTDRCDILDVLEESVTTGRTVAVEVAGGGQFVDLVREVVTTGGEDFAEFKDHGRLPVNDIRSATRAGVG